ncbi:MAG: NUDIX hydrolase [Armatimonadetes bacterium]|nr:NUDIX hydrolase [Armatimonadota bacterium]
MSREPEEILTREVIYRGPYISVERLTVALPSGKTATRDVVRHPGAVGMVVVDDQGRLHLVRQYRRAIDDWSVEIPAGTLEPNELPEAAVDRELGEEVGVRARRVEHLMTFVPSPGMLDERVHLYLCRDLEPNVLDREEESFDVLQVARDEAHAMIRCGEIQDAKSILGIYLSDPERVRGS